MCFKKQVKETFRTRWEIKVEGRVTDYQPLNNFERWNDNTNGKSFFKK